MTARKISEEKPVWLVLTNSDLTEGRGQNYVKHVTETEATAVRLAKGNYVQGTNCPVQKGFAIRINATWFIPGLIVSPTIGDIDYQKRLDAQHEKDRARAAAIEKARSLGLSDEEIEALK